MHMILNYYTFIRLNRKMNQKMKISNTYRNVTYFFKHTVSNSNETQYLRALYKTIFGILTQALFNKQRGGVLEEDQFIYKSCKRQNVKFYLKTILGISTILQQIKIYIGYKNDPASVTLQPLGRVLIPQPLWNKFEQTVQYNMTRFLILKHLRFLKIGERYGTDLKLCKTSLCFS